MDPQTITVLVQLGAGGVFLYAFLTDKLRTKAQVDEIRAQDAARLAEVHQLYTAALEERDERIEEACNRGDEWKKLALGTERRLDQVAPVVAAAAGVPVPSAPAEAKG